MSIDSLDTRLEAEIIMDLICNYPIPEKCLVMSDDETSSGSTLSAIDLNYGTAEPIIVTETTYQPKIDNDFKTFTYEIPEYNEENIIDISSRISSYIKRDEDEVFCELLKDIPITTLDNNDDIQTNIAEIACDMINGGTYAVNLICSENTVERLGVYPKMRKRLSFNLRDVPGVDVLSAGTLIEDNIIYLLPSAERVGVVYTRDPLHIENNAITQTLSLNIHNPQNIKAYDISALKMYTNAEVKNSALKIIDSIHMVNCNICDQRIVHRDDLTNVLCTICHCWFDICEEHGKENAEAWSDLREHFHCSECQGKNDILVRCDTCGGEYPEDETKLINCSECDVICRICDNHFTVLEHMPQLRAIFDPDKDAKCRKCNNDQHYYETYKMLQIPGQYADLDKFMEEHGLAHSHQH